MRRAPITGIDHNRGLHVVPQYLKVTGQLPDIGQHPFREVSTVFAAKFFQTEILSHGSLPSCWVRTGSSTGKPAPRPVQPCRWFASQKSTDPQRSSAGLLRL